MLSIAIKGIDYPSTHFRHKATRRYTAGSLITHASRGVTSSLCLRTVYQTYFYSVCSCYELSGDGGI